ncbi:putative membrane protein [cyanobiont of Ornithocercus magnificus]|nr:putative membrane protein [cyanobiont of Ornithocercus magnificus]
MLSGLELISLEKIAHRAGSGIQCDDLIARWFLRDLWSKDGSSAVPGIVFLLRTLHASLILSDAEDDSLKITNQISIGALRLQFRGSANLKGRLPLLQFSFESVELILAGKKLLTWYLPQNTIKQRPFFALIAVDREKGWLAARGQSGTLGLWFTG